jgi:hypothetical protein
MCEIIEKVCEHGLVEDVLDEIGVELDLDMLDFLYAILENDTSYISKVLNKYECETEKYLNFSKLCVKLIHKMFEDIFKNNSKIQSLMEQEIDRRVYKDFIYTEGSELELD